MHQFQTQLDTLQRPKLLIRAARAAISDSRWSLDDKIGGATEGNQTTFQRFNTLVEEERRLNEERLECYAAYNVRKHISALAALMVVAAGSKPRQQAA